MKRKIENTYAVYPMICVQQGGNGTIERRMQHLEKVPILFECLEKRIVILIGVILFAVWFMFVIITKLSFKQNKLGRKKKRQNKFVS